VESGVQVEVRRIDHFVTFGNSVTVTPVRRTRCSDELFGHLFGPDLLSLVEVRSESP